MGGCGSLQARERKKGGGGEVGREENSKTEKGEASLSSVGRLCCGWCGRHFWCDVMKVVVWLAFSAASRFR